MIQSTTVAKYGNAMAGLQENIIRLEMNYTASDAINFKAEIEHFAIVDIETGAKTGIETNGAGSNFNTSNINMTIEEYHSFSEDIVGVGENYKERLFSRKQQFLMKWLLNNPMWGVETWELIN
jgi:hypothetical protein